jgi:hypothetical protein
MAKKELKRLKRSKAAATADVACEAEWKKIADIINNLSVLNRKEETSAVKKDVETDYIQPPKSKKR